MKKREEVLCAWQTLTDTVVIPPASIRLEHPFNNVFVKDKWSRIGFFSTPPEDADKRRNRCLAYDDGQETQGVQKWLEMKDVRDLKDLTIHDVQPMSDE